jgi:hypothetical protein
MSPFPEDPPEPPPQPVFSAWPDEPPIVVSDPVVAEGPVASPAPIAPPAPVAPTEPLNPWLHIWTRPRAVTRQILDTDPRRLVHLIAMLAGIAQFLGWNPPDLPGFTLPLPAVIGLKIVLGALSGLLGLYLFSALVLMTGRWLGGRGRFVGVRAATAWASVPVIWGAMLWLPLLACLGWEALNLDTDTLAGDPVGLLLLVPIGLLTVIVGIWRFVIYLKAVGEAHGFSAWQAFGALLIAIVLVVIPIVAMGAMAALFLGLAGSRLG